ncbi:hypothetical protein [Nonomuraea sp. NPDC005650]|uniref:hypothetical protein n=1 Tax=Nonomuraea sp. NPDC005650 TaxID=3157045 RepID=UPI0033A0D631
MEALRYRPNLVIGTEAEGFVENDWVGRELRIGDEVALAVIVAGPRCAVPTLGHGSLGRDPDALRTVARHNRVPVSGAYEASGVRYLSRSSRILPAAVTPMPVIQTSSSTV